MFHFNKSSCAAITLLAGTALAPGAFAQEAVQDCPGLQAYLDQNRANLSENQVRQADESVRRGEAEACVLIFTQLNEEQAQQQGEANIVVQQPAPTVTVDAAAPQVSVQQTPPNVTVRQAQPQIIVRQPAPVVTIDIPQPEIVVRMPQPEVMVQQAQPQVQVQQQQPEVRVDQAQPEVQVAQRQEPQVLLRQAEGRANVQVEQVGEANVTYERAEPNVLINQAEGQPTVTVEQMPGQPGQAGQQQAAVQQQTTPQPQAGAESGMQPIAVIDIEGMQVVNARGEQIGEVENVVRSTVDNKEYVVILHGGFLDLADKRVALSAEDLTVQGDQVMVPTLTDEEIRALPAFGSYDQNFPEVEDTAQLQMRSAQ